MNTMLSYADKLKFTHPIKMWVAGAPPPPSLIAKFEKEIGITIETVSIYRYHIYTYKYYTYYYIYEFISYIIYTYCINMDIHVIM